MPISYMVDGVQYIAVQSGWGVDAERMQGSLIAAGYKGKNYDPNVPIPQGGVLWVFAVGKEGLVVSDVERAGCRGRCTARGVMRWSRHWVVIDRQKTYGQNLVYGCHRYHLENRRRSGDSFANHRERSSVPSVFADW